MIPNCSRGSSFTPLVHPLPGGASLPGERLDTAAKRLVRFGCGLAPLVIGLDFDSCLFNTNTVWLHRFRQQTGHHVVADNILNWDFSPAIPAELLPELWEARTPDMYMMVRPMPEADIAVAKMALRGHLLVCVTSDSGDFASIKAELLRWYFPGVRDLVVAKDKWAAVPGMHLLVDDAPHNLPTHLLPQPWNSPRNRQRWQDRQAQFWRGLPHLVDRWGRRESVT